jgi:hypothetical protein
VISSKACALALTLLVAGKAAAQDNYEIQVYGADLVPARHTMFELHSNFTFQGSTSSVGGMFPTQHALHETLEITHGFTSTFETGFYIFTSFRGGSQGYQYVGSHIRPRWAAPASWHWRFGASLSLEFGYQRPQFSQDTWTLEVRPIVDKQIGHLYLSFNPALARSIAGVNAGRGFVFSPNAKVSYDLTPKITTGLEYYGSLGPLNEFDSVAQQQHQLFASLDLNMGEEWEFNAGVGEGFTASTDHMILKCILGRRFSF